LTSKILYKSSVGRDLRKLSPKDKERILRQVKTTLRENPRVGEPLHGEFEGLYKLRVGDYRVIYALTGQDVLVLRVRHRGKAYG
jgi:mRNA interferase RelE/StbE